jgi:uncharacterized protein (DUF305 family)
MNERMMAIHGASPSDTWLRMMIEHHRGAVEMSEILIAQGGDPNALEEARVTAREQRREQQELERVLQAGITGGTGPANPFAEAEARMNERMMAIHGASPSDTWLRMMIEHHRGAAEMANIIIRQGGDPGVVEMARRTLATQNREIAELERLVTGEHQAADVAKAEAADQDPPARSSDTKATPSQPPAARPERPAPRPKVPPADPHAGHDMANMSHSQ